MVEQVSADFADFHLIWASIYPMTSEKLMKPRMAVSVEDNCMNQIYLDQFIVMIRTSSIMFITR